MTSPRLLVIASELPEVAFPDDMERYLKSILGYRVGSVNLVGSVAYPFSRDSLFRRAILGEDTEEDRFMGKITKGCDLYVGVKTPEREEFPSIRTSDDKYEAYQLGEIGFELASSRNIHAILLPEYKVKDICDFVKKQK